MDVLAIHACLVSIEKCHGAFPLSRHVQYLR